MTADDRHEGAHDHDRHDERDDEADRDIVQFARVEHRAVLPQFEDSRAEHRRDSKEEAELRRRAPFDPQAERPHDRRAAAANPWDHREALGKADADGGFGRNVGDADDRALFRELLYGQYRDAAHNQCDGDDFRMTKQRLDLLVEGEADHPGGEEAENDVANKAPRQAVARDNAADNADERAPVQHHDREDRAQLDDDVEQLPRIGVEAEKAACEDQMPGRRHGEEFGHALDDAQNDYIEQGMSGRSVRHFGVSASRWKRPDVR